MSAGSAKTVVDSPRAVLRLEDLGFGSTLAGIAVMVLAHFSAPAVEQGAAIAQWFDHCYTVVRTIASAAFGLVA